MNPADVVRNLPEIDKRKYIMVKRMQGLRSIGNNGYDGCRLEKKRKEKRNTPIQYGFFIFLLVMAVYSLWRMFAIEPWFDETYTYRKFIDRGVWYCMTHWPLPTNHVFYCVLSAILNLCGNGYIGLRGVSYLASLLNLVLLFRLLKKLFSEETALVGCICYAGFWNVMDLSVQGRGYTLSNTFLLLCLICVIQIFEREIALPGEKIRKEKTYFLGYAISMFLALYTVPTNLYWILPLCLAIFVKCAVDKEWGILWRFIRYGILGAALTVLVYGLIWTATGLDLLGFISQGRLMAGVTVSDCLVHFPQILAAGLKDMLSNEIIQPVGHEAAFLGIGQWILGLAGEMAGSGKVIFPLAMGVFMISYAVTVVRMIRSRKGAHGGCWFMQAFSVLSFSVVLVMLLLQGTLPFYRCFLWMCVPVLYVVLEAVTAVVGRKIRINRLFQKQMWYLMCCILLTAGLYLYGRSSYEEPSNENEIKEILEHTPEEMNEVIWTDSRIELCVYFTYGDTFTEDRDTPDHIIMKKAVRDKDYTGYWDDYYLYDDLPWNYIDSHMEVYYETEEYAGYRVK